MNPDPTQQAAPRFTRAQEFTEFLMTLDWKHPQEALITAQAVLYVNRHQLRHLLTVYLAGLLAMPRDRLLQKLRRADVRSTSWNIPLFLQSNYPFEIRVRWFHQSSPSWRAIAQSWELLYTLSGEAELETSKLLRPIDGHTLRVGTDDFSSRQTRPMSEGSCHVLSPGTIRRITRIRWTEPFSFLSVVGPYEAPACTFPAREYGDGFDVMWELDPAEKLQALAQQLGARAS